MNPQKKDGCTYSISPCALTPSKHVAEPRCRDLASKPTLTPELYCFLRNVHIYSSHLRFKLIRNRAWSAFIVSHPPGIMMGFGYMFGGY